MPIGRSHIAAIAGALLGLFTAAPSQALGDPIAALPGAEPFSDALRMQLAKELASRGLSYVPRSRNRRPDGSPRFTNRLLLEASPYLGQHAHNPVNWFPWGDEAFETAARLGRPVLVSIGYSTCHWCHVMEDESFDDPEVAEFLNQHFIAIKVDREARPDVDAVYMAAIHAMNGRGGWPLNVFVTPDRVPFYAGTYFPPEDRGSRLGFSNVLRMIQQRFEKEPESVAKVADSIAARVRSNLEEIAATASDIPPESTLSAASKLFISKIDPVWGGIGRKTKFPSTVPTRFLLRIQRRSGDATALRRVELTLDKMAAGGIRDHLGGGFHRYSTEPRWLIPHFEKMLYDNALLAQAYLEASIATGREDFASITREILDYVSREMTAPSGAFFSATDADSLTPSGEAAEGWFFTWTPAETTAVLGTAKARTLNAYFGISEAGDLDGRSILRGWRSSEDVAAEVGSTTGAVLRIVDEARAPLLAARALRKPPLLDDKILAAWNGLMIQAFAQAAFAFDDEPYLRRAQRAADFVLRQMRSDGRLSRVFVNGRAAGPAFLEDYAFMIAGLIDLYEADADPRWLREAISLQAVLDRDYFDQAGGGYWKTNHDHERLLAREKPNRDGAVPSGNSVAAMNLLRLEAFTSDPRYHERAILLFSAFNDTIVAQPTRLPELLLALDFFLGTTREVLLVRPADGSNESAMRSALRKTYAPNRIVSTVTEGHELRELARLIPLLSGKSARRGLTTAYVCENRVCKYPTTDPGTFAAQLTGSNAAAPPQP
ncbi:MAG: thioredoxin domain-containing protein [Deltaproteobacteria bacterium]|nr:thioredoxin domain-containing protein [Deltaproteobacteria bacterium]